VDVGERCTRRTDWQRLLNINTVWLEALLGHAPVDAVLYERALTHGSRGGDTYERLEFLGDRVLGLVIAQWLYDDHPDDPEGKLSSRLNALVSRATCAQIGRDVALAPHILLGKQAMDDGAFDSDNVLGDVVESLIGALYLEHGLEAARIFIKRHWYAVMSGQTAAPHHPKSALQEWAAAHNRKPPIYDVIERSGPDHAPKYRIKVSLGSAGEAEADGASKQEAETAAAAALLEKLA
jgi:ribonuclease III